jgi:hypothetical protein
MSSCSRLSKLNWPNSLGHWRTTSRTGRTDSADERRQHSLPVAAACTLHQIHLRLAAAAAAIFGKLGCFYNSGTPEKAELANNFGHIAVFGLMVGVQLANCILSLVQHRLYKRLARC